MSLHGRRPAEQAAHLQLLGRAAAAANECPTLGEAAAVVMEEVCRYTGWPVGHLYVAGAGGTLLVPTGTWWMSEPERFAALRRAIEAAPIGPGIGLPGRVMATASAVWVDDLRADSYYPGTAAGAHPPVRAAFCFPVVVGEAVVAVMEFFAEEAEAPEDGLLDVVACTGHLLARVAEREQAGAALRQSEERLRAVCEAVPDAVIVTELAGRIASMNRGAERSFGYLGDEVVNRPVTILLADRSHEPYRSVVERLEMAGSADPTPITVELSGRRRDGTEFPVQLTLSTWATPEGRFSMAIVRDVTELRQALDDRRAFEQQLAQRSLHDALTSLPNRVLLLDRLERGVARAVRRGSFVAVVSMNVDRFKAVNDRYGHPVGDALLVAVATRLQEILQPDETLARVGGDQFALLSEDLTSPTQGLEIGERLCAALRRPFRIHAHELSISASVGVAVAPQGGDHDLEALRNADPDQLLRDAEVAVTQARRRGRGHAALYQPGMRAEATEGLAVEHELRLAITSGQLRVHYQPVVDLATGMIDGVEALVRWEHPSRGLLQPAEFIGLAEDSGLIVPLGRWVLDQACYQGAAWSRDLGPSGRVRVSVNVSARQFQQPDWTDEVAQALLRSGLEPERLVLEITESVLMEDTDATAQRLADLRGLGVRIAIDDFGTGYSSLGYLRLFPIDILKVDKSFIDGVADGPHESALARAVIKLAASLHLDAVAEGVGTRKQLAMLRRLRCRYAQGYYFARPQPTEVVRAMLTRRLPLGEGGEAGALAV